MVLITISSLLLAGAVVAADGGGKDSSTAGAVKSQTFNVMNYGAVGDDKTDIYNVQASKPTRGTAGISTPACNNGALTILRNVIVTGYHTGILVNEHTDGDNIVVASNINGLEFLFAHHASRFGRVGTYRNTHHVTVSGRHGFSIEQMNTEQPGPGQTDANNAWQALVSDVNDPKNLGFGDINYWVVEGNVGAVEKFVCNGGASIRARRIGSAPKEDNTTTKSK
jgi:hypothetical protein